MENDKYAELVEGGVYDVKLNYERMSGVVILRKLIGDEFDVEILHGCEAFFNHLNANGCFTVKIRSQFHLSMSLREIHMSFDEIFNGV